MSGLLIFAIFFIFVFLSVPIGISLGLAVVIYSAITFS